MVGRRSDYLAVLCDLFRVLTYLNREVYECQNDRDATNEVTEISESRLRVSVAAGPQRICHFGCYRTSTARLYGLFAWRLGSFDSEPETAG